MFFLESDRIRLIPLTLEQLYALKSGRNELDKMMGLTLSDLKLNSDEDMLGELSTGLDNLVIPWVKGNPGNYRWFTHWIFVDIATNLNIGGIGLAGLPDENGNAYLGYYIDEKFEGKGYTTEALSMLLAWMFENPELQIVTADTLVDGYGSQKVLQKNGFVYSGTTDEGLRWKRAR